MPDDLRALLAAIVADPADDTARLVYADCLQEHGNLPRADFIRLQIEAERLHPDSNARARLEEKAQALFAEHWIEWWREVCQAVEFPLPAPKGGRLLGRLARRMGIFTATGQPFETDGFTVRRAQARLRSVRLAEWFSTTFRRGFPDSVGGAVAFANRYWSFYRTWPTISPLTDLHLADPRGDVWNDGPYLSRVRSLTLEGCHPVALAGVLSSTHLVELEDLSLKSLDYQGEYDPRFTRDLTSAMQSPQLRRLKRLSIPLWSHRAAEVVAGAENLAGLEALEVSLQPAAVDDDMEYGSADLAVAGERLATLARSPYLAGLQELKVVGGLDAAGVEAAIRNPTWTGLKKLNFQLWSWPDGGDLLGLPDELPALEELRLSGVSYSVAQVAALARSPLLKRLRHFALRGGPNLSVDFDIAHAVDPNRIETFAIGAPEISPRVRAMLQDRFGDRFRILE
jgi:uncharacterized protein (TIGR02996 family)